MSKLLRLAAVVLCVGVLVLGVVFFDSACPLTSLAPRDPNPRGSLADSVIVDVLSPMKSRSSKVHEAILARGKNAAGPTASASRLDWELAIVSDLLAEERLLRGRGKM